MRAVMAQRGLDWRVDSAGTAAWHVGKPPDPRAQAEALRHGVDISRLQARQACAEDYTRFTHIFAADDSNLADLERLAADAGSAKLSLLLGWVPGREGQAVADPYYGDASGFSRTWEEVHAAASAIADQLQQAS